MPEDTKECVMGSISNVPQSVAGRIYNLPQLLGHCHLNQYHLSSPRPLLHHLPFHNAETNAHTTCSMSNTKLLDLNLLISQLEVFALPK